MPSAAVIGGIGEGIIAGEQIRATKRELDLRTEELLLGTKDKQFNRALNLQADANTAIDKLIKGAGDLNRDPRILEALGKFATKTDNAINDMFASAGSNQTSNIAERLRLIGTTAQTSAEGAVVEAESQLAGAGVLAEGTGTTTRGVLAAQNQVPGTPKPIIVKPNETVLNPDGSILFQAQGVEQRINIPPNAIVVDQDGTTIAENPVDDSFTLGPNEKRFEGGKLIAEGALLNKGSATNILMPDGSTRLGRTTPEGNTQIVDDRGNFIAAPVGAKIIEVASEAKDLPDQILLRKVVEVRAGLRNFAALVKDTARKLRDPNLVLGVAGKGLVFAQNIGAQARQLGTAFGDSHFDSATGEDLTVEQILDESRYNFDGLQAIASANVRVRANATALGYILARMRDPQGRLSDFDVQAAIDSLGFNSADPEVIIATLNDRLREVVTNADNFIRFVFPNAESGFSQFLPLETPQQAVPSYTLDELDALSRGE